jgi:hypothetical protein
MHKQTVHVQLQLQYCARLTMQYTGVAGVQKWAEADLSVPARCNVCPCRKAEVLEARAREISARNRAMLAAAAANPEEPAPLLRAAADPVDPASRLVTPAGAVVTLRLAQQMLAEFCAKLPGSDR